MCIIALNSTRYQSSWTRGCALSRIGGIPGSAEELMPGELRQRTIDDQREVTFQRTHQIRIDYFLALGRIRPRREL